MFSRSFTPITQFRLYILRHLGMFLLSLVESTESKRSKPRWKIHSLMHRNAMGQCCQTISYFLPSIRIDNPSARFRRIASLLSSQPPLCVRYYPTHRSTYVNKPLGFGNMPSITKANSASCEAGEFALGWPGCTSVLH